MYYYIKENGALYREMIHITGTIYIIYSDEEKRASISIKERMIVVSSQISNFPTVS